MESDSYGYNYDTSASEREENSFVDEGPSWYNPGNDDDDTYYHESEASNTEAEVETEDEAARISKQFVDDLKSMQEWVENVKAKGFTHLRDFAICKPGKASRIPIRRYRCLAYGCHRTSNFLWPYCETHSIYVKAESGTNDYVAKKLIPKGTRICPTGIWLRSTTKEEEANVKIQSQKESSTYFFGRKTRWYKAHKEIAKDELLVIKFRE